MRTDKDVVESSGELVDKIAQKPKVSQKLVPILRPAQPFPQRLVKKTKECKIRQFITVLK